MNPCKTQTSIPAQRARLGRTFGRPGPLLREWSTGDETSTQFVEPSFLQVLDAVDGTGDEATARPTTGHPLARDFAGSDWESARAIRRLASKGEPSLSALARACVARERLLRQRIEEIQRQIDDEVYRLYEVSDEDRALIEQELGKLPEAEAEGEGEVESADSAEQEVVAPAGLLPAEEHVKRLVHYLAHEALKADPEGIVPLADSYTADGRLERGLAHRVRDRLRGLFGEAALPSVERELEAALGVGLDHWLATGFFAYHVGLYRLRPVVWQVASKPRGEAAFSCFVYWHRLGADTLRKVQEVYLRPALESARREAEQASSRVWEQREAKVPLRVQREVERAYQRAKDRRQELQTLSRKIQRLLQAQQLAVPSRSAWVPEKVREVVARSYGPNRDYGVKGSASRSRLAS